MEPALDHHCCNSLASGDQEVDNQTLNDMAGVVLFVGIIFAHDS